MAIKKLNINKNLKQNILVVKNDVNYNEEIIAAYKFDTEEDVKAIIKDLGWFKGYSKSELYKATECTSLADIAYELVNSGLTIDEPGTGGKTTLEVVQLRNPINEIAQNTYGVTYGV